MTLPEALPKYCSCLSFFLLSVTRSALYSGLYTKFYIVFGQQSAHGESRHGVGLMAHLRRLNKRSRDIDSKQIKI